jgi:glycosyltransferase involved in cell wall biosynthesis
VRVLHLTLSFAPGGRRQAITTLLRHLPRASVGCELACLDRAGCPLEELMELSPSAMVIGRRGLLDLRAANRLLWHCRRNNIDLIHAHDAASQFAGMCVRLARPRTRLVMTFHRSLGFESARRRDRARNAIATAACGAIIAGSRERRSHFLAENYVSPRKVVRIPFGIDTERFQPCLETRNAIRAELGFGPADVVLGAVGHFGPEKGIDLVLQGFNELLARRRDRQSDCVSLVICGRGTAEQEQQMRTLVRAGHARLVRFAGFQTEIWRWLQAFDLLVHAPREEAFGLVLIEAMAAGLPVVATRVGGIPDIVRTGQTGLLVPPDNPRELASALESLTDNGDLRRSMSIAARSTAVSEYDSEIYARRHVRLYEAVLAGRQPLGADDEEPADTSFDTTPKIARYSVSSHDCEERACPRM